MSGPACMTCREKCRKCDRGRPSCQRCISKGLVCRGYPDQFRFCGIASRGKWKDARIPAVDKEISQQRHATLIKNQMQQPPSGSSTPPGPRRSRRLAIDSMLVKHADEADDITGLLTLTQTKTLLHHYDTFICPHQLAEIGDDEDNPYRAYILPLAKKQIGLLDMHETTAVEYRMKAIRALGEQIYKSQTTSLSKEEQDAVFATIQILLLHDIAETGISEHGVHITGAMSVCKTILLADGFNGQRQRAVFFIGNLAWYIREMVASAGGHRFELVNGCPREIFLIIGRALEKAKQYKNGWTTDEDFRSTLLCANQELYSWDPRSKTYPSSDPRWVNVGIAFQFACILHIHRLLDPLQPANSPEIKEAVMKILDATADVPADCTLIELLILPLFMAGADSLSRHSQYYILARFREIERRSEIRNPVPADLLKKVWAARSAQDGHENISWRDFTCFPELTRQHDYLII
ncbi:fungal-specific transcription factor domain-containing protein [Aspergillus similis]